MKVLLVSELIEKLNLHPPLSIPDHSILRATFKTSHYEGHLMGQSQIITGGRSLPNVETKSEKKNLNKMSLDFFMTQEIRSKVLGTIEKIESSQKSIVGRGSCITLDFR